MPTRRKIVHPKPKIVTNSEITPTGSVHLSFGTSYISFSSAFVLALRFSLLLRRSCFFCS